MRRMFAGVVVYSIRQCDPIMLKAVVKIVNVKVTEARCAKNVFEGRREKDEGKVCK